MLLRNLAVGAAIAACAAVAPGPGRAQPVSGFYVSAGAGLDGKRDVNAETNRSDGARFTFEPGWTGGAAAGYGFGNGLRVEGEASYRRSPLDQADGVKAAGALIGRSAVANLIYDVGTGSAWTPYAGIGAGVLQVRASDFILADRSTITGTDTVFAHQWLVGLGYRLSDRVMVDLGYRDLAAGKAVFAVRSSNGASSNTTVALNSRHHSVLLSLRYEFTPAAIAR